MGQAKNRGTFEQRQAEAIERDRIEVERRQKELIVRRSALGNRSGKSRLALATALSIGLSRNFDKY